MKKFQVSSQNQAFQYAETLRRNRVKRQKKREFFVEGVNQINALISSSFEIRAFYSKKKLSNWAQKILNDQQADQHYELTDKLMAELSDKEKESELIAITKMPLDNLSRISKRAPFRLLVLDRPVSPGNIGTIIRSADAFGANGMIITGHAADIYDPKCIQASLGALFTLPVLRLPSQTELLPFIDCIKKDFPDLKLVGTSTRLGKSSFKTKLEGPIVLLLGNETHGLSRAYQDLADFHIKIPMQGVASSLNIGCAASILLHEILRQQRLS